MTNFEKWKQNLKPEDLIIDKGENVDEDECRHVVGIADNCSNCPANGKCGHDYWTDCGEAFIEWAKSEATGDVS